MVEVQAQVKGGEGRGYWRMGEGYKRTGRIYMGTYCRLNEEITEGDRELWVVRFCKEGVVIVA